MKDILIAFLEGALVGIAMAVVIVVMGIEMTTAQMAILIAVAVFTGSIAASIGGMLKKGKDTVYYSWVFRHGQTRFEVTAGLVERLYIDDVLVAESTKIALKAVELKGKLETGEEVRAVITGGVGIKCELFVGDEKLQPISTKTP